MNVRNLLAIHQTFVLMLGLAISSNALAFCTAYPSVTQEYDNSDVVASVIVQNKVDIASVDDPSGIERTVYTLEILHYFKGRSGKIFQVISENTSSRFDMDVSVKYLVFTNKYMATNVVNSCGNSGVLTKRQAEIKEIVGVRLN